VWGETSTEGSNPSLSAIFFYAVGRLLGALIRTPDLDAARKTRPARAQAPLIPFRFPEHNWIFAESLKLLYNANNQQRRQKTENISP
jgi:hypothetical protein